MKRFFKIGSLVIVVILAVVLVATYKEPLNTVEHLKKAVENFDLEIITTNDGKTYYPDENGNWTCKEGELSSEEKQDTEKNFAKLRENKLKMIEGIRVPESYDEMMEQFSQYGEDMAYTYTALLMIVVEKPEYFILPSAYLEDVPSSDIEVLRCVAEIYNNKRISEFQRSVIERDIENLDFWSYDISGE